jgi:hypothetical protein
VVSRGASAITRYLLDPCKEVLLVVKLVPIGQASCIVGGRHPGDKEVKYILTEDSETR